MNKLLALAAALMVTVSAQSAAPSFAGQIIYQIMPDRFFDGDTGNDAGVDRSDPGGWHGGDLKGVTDKLNYIKTLGATALWLTPIYLQPDHKIGSAVGYHGYWPWDFRAVDPHFGTLDDFRSLVTKAHADGLKVVLDQVINHFGYDAPAVTQHPNWFHSTDQCLKAQDKATDCPLAGLPDLNQQVPAVRALLEGNSDFWRQTGVDAFRYDAVNNVDPGIISDLGPKNRMEGLWTLGEAFGADPDRIAQLQQAGLASAFDFALRDALASSIMGGGSLSQVADQLALEAKLPRPNEVAIFLDNHDLPRFASGSLFEDEGQARTMYGLRALMTLPGVPVLWQGTEIAMRGGMDPDNRQDMRFESQWTAGEKVVFMAAQGAIAVRKANPALATGDTTLLALPDNLSANLLAFTRSGGGERVLVAWNNANARTTYSLKSKLPGLALTPDLFGQKAGASVSGDYLHLSLPPHAAAAFKLP